MRGVNWDNFVRGSSMRYGGMEQAPEGVMETYHDTNKHLTYVRERLKNPVSLKGGGPLQPRSIYQLERQEKELIQKANIYRNLIKRLVKYNLLPTSKLISGADRKQFCFSLQTMIELPEFGEAVYYANRLMGSRYDAATPSTNDGYVQRQKSPMYCPTNKQEERSRESMYNVLVNALNKTTERVKKERQRLLLSGEPWKSPKNDPTMDTQSAREVKGLKKEQDDVEGRWKISCKLLKEDNERLEADIARLETENYDRRRRDGQKRPENLLGPEFEAFLKKQKKAPYGKLCLCPDSGRETYGGANR